MGAEWARAVGYNEQRNAALNEQRATKHTGTQRVASNAFRFLFRILFRDHCGGMLFTCQIPADRDAALMPWRSYRGRRGRVMTVFSVQEIGVRKIGKRCNGQRIIGLRGNGVCRFPFRILIRDHCGDVLLTFRIPADRHAALVPRRTRGASTRG